ncbi:Inositol hexakisphosphate and diphosphoinositol-pentakisphosphate kinase [Mycena indigotica]|uniref:Inositol hexakisphosphate and diphosphoinositol-pentakisphosphate kinase n=1 Tax=Mycena indigotica TaxID=2126181 RepID=A0A8H6SPL5_9AGAR|nr:Inositol hexakisphosphate and diphosphoinositol-pentakisphosphate kinase [Mycena indigotica]KAF7301660.1 Inositol hexakisphosphate and diphosphoinositol-pentakisphosphate kinase [Mycena indigotica]
MSRSRLSNIFHSPDKQRSSSVLTRSSSPASSSHSLDAIHSPLHPDSNETIVPRNAAPIVLGICAMDVKARSKAMREILTRLVERASNIEVKVFGDKVILDEDVENWPRCDVLISFFSTDFPLDKAISYVKLRRPFCINDLSLQALLWDRRLVGAVLDHLQVPTPPRLEVSRDGGPTVDPELKDLVKTKLGLSVGDFRVAPEVVLREDGDAIIIDGQVLEKPFVEKPVSGEDHNVYIYFRGGGGRRLFRKVGNKSSDLDPTLNHPRTDGSYIYEQFIDVDNSEDIKVYTVGQEYTHAETRKSPVVDGVVRRNTDGKEIRFITRLSEEEKTWAKKICEGFGQRVCGYDMLRCDGGQRSQVIDVNGWSFVKGNESYYDRAAEILAGLCMRLSVSPDRPLSTEQAPTWLLKANVTVFRHADRTPKQKLKFNFPIGEDWTQPFVTLLNGEKEEIILREKTQLSFISAAVNEAKTLGANGEDLAKLSQLSNALLSKIDLPGTKAQLKPVYSKRQAGQVRRLTKLTLVFKWGGEFTHSARYQSRDLGENMKKDISIMNKDALNNVKIFTSSERRVIASAEIFAAALVDSQNSAYSAPPSTASSNSNFSAPTSNASSLSSRSSTDMSNLNKGQQTPLNLIVRKDLLDDSNAAKDLMDDVKKRLKILLRPGESEKRPELTWPKSMNKEPVEVVKEVIELLSSFRGTMHKNFENMDVDKIQERWCCGDEPWLFRERWEKLFEDFCDVEQKKFDPSRVSELYDTIKYCALHHRTFLFAIFDEHGRSDTAQPPGDRKLHELYGRAKALFDLVAPQEYGIEPEEKEEIGVLTSLPLLRNVVADLEAARNHGGSSLRLYFTKESHIHTLVNLVLHSGLPIANRRIPELDYCSHITFELYERNHGRGMSDKEYSIKLSLSEGAHSSNVLDSTLDARHSLNVQARKKLTQHLPYSLVIEKLSKHFHRMSDDNDTDDFETIKPHPVLAMAGNGDSSSSDL